MKPKRSLCFCRIKHVIFIFFHEKKCISVSERILIKVFSYDGKIKKENR